MKSLEPTTTVQLDPSLLYSRVGDEIVLLTVESGKYFKVDPVGSRIWELIKEPTTIQNLCELLVEEYEISSEQCYEDTIPFLESLIKDDLILIS